MTHPSRDYPRPRHSTSVAIMLGFTHFFEWCWRALIAFVVRKTQAPSPIAPIAPIPPIVPIVPIKATLPPAPMPPARSTGGLVIGNYSYAIYAYPDRAVVIVKYLNGFREHVLLTPEQAVLAKIPMTVAGLKELIRATHPNVCESVIQGRFRVQQAVDVTGPITAPDHAAIDLRPSPRVKLSPAKLSLPPPPKKTAPARRFTGLISAFGWRTCPPKPPQNKPYETYFMEVTGPYSVREFIGEQLCELVEQQHLAVGNEIALTPLGKTPFTVLVNGKPERRHRNEYRIDLI